MKLDPRSHTGAMHRVIRPYSSGRGVIHYTLTDLDDSSLDGVTVRTVCGHEIGGVTIALLADDDEPCKRCDRIARAATERLTADFLHNVDWSSDGNDS